jgi:hypothetical protein
MGHSGLNYERFGVFLVPIVNWEPNRTYRFNLVPMKQEPKRNQISRFQFFQFEVWIKLCHSEEAEERLGGTTKGNVGFWVSRSTIL